MGEASANSVLWNPNLNRLLRTYLMLQAPRRSRYRKSHKMRIPKISYSKGGSKFTRGNIGIKALKSCRVAFRPIEAGRSSLARKVKEKI